MGMAVNRTYFCIMYKWIFTITVRITTKHITGPQARGDKFSHTKDSHNQHLAPWSAHLHIFICLFARNSLSSPAHQTIFSAECLSTCTPEGGGGGKLLCAKMETHFRAVLQSRKITDYFLFSPSSLCILIVWGGLRTQPNVNGLNGSLNLFQKMKISVKLADIRSETVCNLLKQVN